ncbi:FCD domain-containing protein [uncultured Roseibium sp.]|uniref:GntR family transcriptional regulator n=1 Tax=uncultured Roseibium sp. TaxID=1936171 RepID=UPI00321676E0
MRRALEREAIRIISERWSEEVAAALKAHVAEEDEARKTGDLRISVRLAERFHILLAELTENEILLGYMTQLVSRCSLILAIYGRPHSSDCAVCEHGDILTALEKGDPEAAVRLMDDHVGSLEARALNQDAGEGPSLVDILSRHAGEIGLDTPANKRKLHS